MSTFLDAVKSGNVELVRYHLNSELKDDNDLHGALCWAGRKGHVDVLTLLFEHGADVCFRSLTGYTALIWAVLFTPNVSTVQMMIDHGSDINHKTTKFQQTPVHAAVTRPSSEILYLLLSQGADPDMVDTLHNTPLLHAVKGENVSCVKLLLLYNCDVNMSGLVANQLMNPLILALIRDNHEIAKLLILAGARFESPAIYLMYNISRYYHTAEHDLHMHVRPIPLKQQCRTCIRHRLKPAFLDKLKRLPLPIPLKSALKATLKCSPTGMSARRHKIPLNHRILTQSIPVLCYPYNGPAPAKEATSTNFKVIGFTRPGSEPLIYRPRIFIQNFIV